MLCDVLTGFEAMHKYMVESGISRAISKEAGVAILKMSVIYYSVVFI